jgi:hypothetical protein
MRDKNIGLEDKAYRMVAVAVPVPVLKIPGGFSVYAEVTLGIPVKAPYDIEQGGFSAAGGAQYGNKLIFTEA